MCTDKLSRKMRRESSGGDERNDVTETGVTVRVTHLCMDSR